MARTVKDIEQDIRTLSNEEKVELMRTLIAELDAPADPDIERDCATTKETMTMRFISK